MSNPELTHESITLATGETSVPQEIERERAFAEIKEDADVQLEETQFNQPDIDDTVLEEQEYGVTVIKMSPTIDSHKETLTDVLDVMMINAAAGNSASISDIEKDLLRQTKIDLSECTELLEAIVFGDTVELQDALSDKRVTLNGFATFLPISLSKNFNITRDMLFTRFDKTIHDAVRTKEKYAAMGVETYIVESTVGDKVFYANKVSKDVTGTNDEFFPADKFVKSINYNKEKFSPIPGIFNPYDTEALSGRWNVIRSMLEGFIANTDAKVAEFLGQPKNETI